MPDQLPADAGITVEDLPWDRQVNDGDLVMIDDSAAIADSQPDAEPDDHADAAFEFGQEFEDLQVKMYRLAVAKSVECEGDKEALKGLQMGLKWNPKHLIRASRLFPELFETDTLNSTDLFASFTICSMCKSGQDAQAAYDWWLTTTPTLGELRTHCKENYGAERGKTPTLAERDAGLVIEWRTLARREVGITYAQGINHCADELAALPEVRKVLERKESDGKA